MSAYNSGGGWIKSEMSLSDLISGFWTSFFGEIVEGYTCRKMKLTDVFIKNVFNVVDWSGGCFNSTSLNILDCGMKSL